MKTYILAIFIVFFVASSCNKTHTPTNKVPGTDTSAAPETPKTLGFKGIPIQNATWYLHYQGSTSIGPNGTGYWDTGYHFYSEITSSGKDTIFDNQLHYIYHVKSHHVHAGKGMDSYMDGIYLIRYDSANNHLVRSIFVGGTALLDRVCLDLNMYTKSGDRPCGSGWLRSTLETGDSISINGIKLPAIYMNHPDVHGKYFYKAEGIGAIGGIAECPYIEISGSGGIIRSLSFVYKSDSLHFDYPLVQQ